MRSLALVAFSVFAAGCGGAADSGLSSETHTPVAPCLDAEDYQCEAETEVFRLVNEARAAAGLHAYVYSGELAWVSRDWSEQQAAAGQISHDGWTAARKALLSTKWPGYTYALTNENVAMFGNFTAVTPKAAAKKLFDQWMSSTTGHREAILSATNRRIGVGLERKNGGKEWYGTQIFGCLNYTCPAE